MNKQKFQILVSSVNYNYNTEYYKTINYLIINQILDNSDIKNKENIYSYKDKGLSKSRNIAISKSSSEICLISDDDVRFKDDIEIIITEAFKNNPKVDIITFQIQTPNKQPYKSYKVNSFYHTKKTIMGVSSIEIAFRRKEIINNKIQFDENFGLGTKYPTGEEIIFLSDALNKGLKILYIPIPIVIHPIESSGKNYDNDKLIMAKGAMFYRLFGFFGYPISVLFTLKKATYSLKYNYIEFVKLMFHGILNYKDNKNA